MGPRDTDIDIEELDCIERTVVVGTDDLTIGRGTDSLKPQREQRQGSQQSAEQGWPQEGTRRVQRWVQFMRELSNLEVMLVRCQSEWRGGTYGWQNRRQECPHSSSQLHLRSQPPLISSQSEGSAQSQLKPSSFREQKKHNIPSINTFRP